jgi:hypothetical protein
MPYFLCPACDVPLRGSNHFRDPIPVAEPAPPEARQR